MENVLISQTTSQWIDILDNFGVPSGPINDIGQAATHPQTIARNMIVSIEDPVTGSMKVAGNPIKISSFEDPENRQPAPNLDQDREDILEEVKD